MTSADRQEMRGAIGAEDVAHAHADLLDLAVEQWPYEVLALRVWDLRANLSVYDASHVALAELSGATLVTLDRRLARAPGPRCAIAVPPARRGR